MTDNPGGVGARFDLAGRVVVITGGAGMLGRSHAGAVAEAGGIPVLADIDLQAAVEAADAIHRRTGAEAVPVELDVTSADSAARLLDELLSRFGRVDVLINNAAIDAKVNEQAPNDGEWSRLENLSIDVWNRDLAVGLTGAFICSQVIGTHMASEGRGVIINIASDLALIGPDQRIYRRAGVSAAEQPVKPVSYSVVKGGLVALTRYLATYWAESGVRVNALCPGGVFADQPEEFVERLTNLIPMGRMAEPDEYQAAVVFLCSDASAYMTGACLVMDGGRTAW